MRAFIVCSLLVLASSQLFPHWNGKESDRHAGYTFEFHEASHSLMIRDEHNCYLVRASPEIAKKYHDRKAQEVLEDDLIKHIHNPANLHKETTLEAMKEFHDGSVNLECRHKTIYELSFKLP